MSVNLVGVGHSEEDWAVSPTLPGIEPRLCGDGSGVKFSCHLLAVTSGKSRILFDLHAPLGPVFGRIEEVAGHLVPSPSSHVGPKPLCAQTLTPHLFLPPPQTLSLVSFTCVPSCHLLVRLSPHSTFKLRHLEYPNVLSIVKKGLSFISD